MMGSLGSLLDGLCLCADIGDGRVVEYTDCHCILTFRL